MHKAHSSSQKALGRGQLRGKREWHHYLMLSITGVSRTRKSRCCWGFCGPFFTSPRGEGGGEKGGNRSPGSRTMCSSSCSSTGRGNERVSQMPLFLDNAS